MLEARCNCGWTASVADVYAGQALHCPLCQATVTPTAARMHSSVPYGYAPYASWRIAKVAPPKPILPMLRPNAGSSHAWVVAADASSRNVPARIALVSGLLALFCALFVAPADGAGVTACSSLLAIACAIIGLQISSTRQTRNSGGRIAALGLACAVFALFASPVEMGGCTKHRRISVPAEKIEHPANVVPAPMPKRLFPAVAPISPKPATLPKAPKPSELEEGEEEF